jgi:hypothetical protein
VSGDGETTDCGLILTSVQHPHILYPPIRTCLPFDSVSIVVRRKMRAFILNEFSSFPKFESVFDLKKELKKLKF